MFKQNISILQFRHFLTITFFLLFSGHLFSQPGKTTKTKCTTQSDTLKASGIYKAQVYFSGNGLPYIKSYINYSSDLSLLMKNIDSARSGAVVTFEYLTFYDGNGVATQIEKIPYNFNRGQDTVKLTSKTVQEVEKLREFKFVSGTIYFQGFGFKNVVSVKAQFNAALIKCFDRSGLGTRITLDNCIYKNPNGTLSSPLSKSFKLE